MAPVMLYLPAGSEVDSAKSVTQITDCGGINLLYRVQEKVFKRSGQNHIACERYGSCDGEIFLQYSIETK